MQLTKGYKQTEVGVIPKDWDVRRLQTFSKVTSGKRLPLGKSLTDKETPHPYIRVKDMKVGRIDQSDLKYVPIDVFPSIKQYRIYKDDLYISVAGSLGIVGPIPINLDGASLTENANRISEISESKKFLLYILLSPIIQNIIDAIQTVGAQPKLALGRIREFPIPLPPTKAEQEAIAGALSDADAWIESLEQLIAKKRRIKEGASQALLTGKQRLPGFTGDWEVKALFEIAEMKKELFDDGDWIEAEHIREDGIRLVQTGNIGVGAFVDKAARKYIDPESFTKLNCKELREGDLLICRLAAPAGRACILPNIGEQKVITSVDVTIFRPREEVANRTYLKNVFSTSEWFSQVAESTGGTTHKRIARGALGKIKILLPKPAEQTAIAEILSEMDAELDALASKLSKARQIKQGMMQELLTGKTRLV